MPVENPRVLIVEDEQIVAVDLEQTLSWAMRLLGWQTVQRLRLK